MSLRGILCTAVGLGLSLVLFASNMHLTHRKAPNSNSNMPDFGIRVTIVIENDDVILRWDSLESQRILGTVYRVYRSSTPEFPLDESYLIAGISQTYFRDEGVLSRYDRCFYRVEAAETVFMEPLFDPPYPGVTIENFESGTAVLYSFEDEDEDPDDWEITNEFAYGNSTYSLYLYGNTWKEMRLDTSQVLTHESTWQVAMRSHRTGEIHALGIGDSTRMLFYVTRGDQMLSLESYNDTYQGTLYDSVWTPYLLAVGNDWEVVYGDLPVITRLVFVNDNDDSHSHGNTYFDEILDVTGNLPQPPQVQIVAMQYPQPMSGPSITGMDPQVNIGFIGRIFDPDGDLMEWFWDFGDGATSTELRPSHTFLRYPHIKVSLTATDSMGFTSTEVADIPIGPPNVNGIVSMALVGDVMIARRYEDPGGIIDTYGADYIFHSVRDLLNSTTIAICNLECPLTVNGWRHPTKEIAFRGRPEYVSALNYAGFEMVSLANNHVWDYMDPGMLETMAVLDSARILRTGAGMNCLLARQPAYITRSGIRIALLGFCNRTGRADDERPYLEAGMSKGGLAMLSYENLDDTVPYAVETADRVVVYFHSGEEYMTAPDVDDMIEDDWVMDTYYGDPLVFRDEPTDQERELRQHAIDLGADLVINSHPHVLQGFEVYNGKVIAHSMGNFAFDQYFWQTYPSALLKTYFDDEDPITDFRVYPIYIDDYIPQPAIGQLGVSILERLMDYSRDLNTYIIPSAADSTVGRIVIDTTMLQETWQQHSVTLALREEEPDVYISEPLALFDGGASPGFVFSVTNNDTVVPCSVAFGREILWVGNFEAEGSTIWNINSEWEWLETEFTHSGGLSLGLTRESSTAYNVITNLEDRMPINRDKDHTFMGWIHTYNGNQAALVTMFYESRSSNYPLVRDTVDTPITGTVDWTFQYEHMDPVEDAYYVNLRCNLFPPDTSVGYAYFDDLAFVEWEAWEDQLPYYVQYPNNLRYLRVLTEHQLDSLQVTYYTVRQWADSDDLP
ncbi:hypothetical protein AMJ86_03900 [bacterium SM23_57]|nr:MAG: hypothetical protein AMJ86_03900 [bacterium SM23_57]